MAFHVPSRAVVPAFRVSPPQREDNINFSIHALMAIPARCGIGKAAADVSKQHDDKLVFLLTTDIAACYR